jgi:hypothetical protein
MELERLRRMDGGNVLVRTTADRRNPPTALRGTFVARSRSDGSVADVRIVLEYPDMFTVPAHQAVIELEAAAVERLAASERDGLFEFEIDASLEPQDPDRESPPT